MASKPCLSPGCPSIAEYRGRCRLHAGIRDKAIHRAGRTVYSTKRWQMLRRKKLNQNPLCERCGLIATDVHHKHGVEADPWDFEGLEALCHSCHSSETRREQLA